MRESEEYSWSSYRAYLGLETIPWLTMEWVFAEFSGRLLMAWRASAKNGETRETFSLDFWRWSGWKRRLYWKLSVSERENHRNNHPGGIEELLVTSTNAGYLWVNMGFRAQEQSRLDSLLYNSFNRIFPRLLSYPSYGYPKSRPKRGFKRDRRAVGNPLDKNKF